MFATISTPPEQQLWSEGSREPLDVETAAERAIADAEAETIPSPHARARAETIGATIGEMR